MAQAHGEPKSGRGSGASGESRETFRTGRTGYLVGAAAVGLGLGLLVNPGRKLAVQSVSALSGDWFDALKTEHDLTRAIFDRMEETNSKQTWKRSILLTQLKHALTKHAIQEENVIYPRLREAGQKEQADSLNHDHGYVKNYLFELSNLGRDDARWLPLVAQFRRDIERHMRQEEDEIFPALRVRLGDDENSKLSAQMNKEGLKVA